MPRVSLLFFGVAPLYAIIGMLVGMYMGATENFALVPAHAHWNLLGWVTMAIYGTFFALAGERVSRRAAWTTFVLANAGVLVMIPMLALYLLSNNPAYIPALVLGEVLTVSAMASFAFAVWDLILRRADQGAAFKASAAE